MYFIRYSVLAGPHPRSLSLGGFAPRSGRRRFSFFLFPFSFFLFTYVSSLLRASLVHERERARTGHVLAAQIVDGKAGVAYQVVDLPIQMTAAGPRAPERCQPILPFPDVWIGGKAVLNKNQGASGSQHAPHLA